MAPPTRANWISIAALGLIWGGTFMVVSVALRGYGPVTVAAARTTLGALALLALVRALDRPLPGRGWNGWRHVATLGVLSSALPFFLLSWGQQYVPSAFAGLSMSALPLFVLPLAHVFSDEPMSARKAAGFGIGFLGALVLLGPGALEGMRGGVTGLAQVACLTAAFCYAVASIVTRRCPPVDPVALSALALAAGSVILLPAMLIVEGLPGWVGPETGIAILFLGLVPTGLAALLRVMVIRSAGSGFMTLVNYQVPLWAMLFGWAVLDEALPARFFIALALILVGIAVSQGLVFTRRRSA